GAYLDYLLEHLELVRMSETAAPGARYRIGAYRFWHRHVAMLLAGSPDPEHAAHAFLAALAAEHVSAVLPELGEARLRAGLARLRPPRPVRYEPSLGLVDYERLGVAGAVGVGSARGASARGAARHRGDFGIPRVQGARAGHLDRVAPGAVRLADHERLLVTRT